LDCEQQWIRAQRQASPGSCATGVRGHAFHTFVSLHRRHQPCSSWTGTEGARGVVPRLVPTPELVVAGASTARPRTGGSCQFVRTPSPEFAVFILCSIPASPDPDALAATILEVRPAALRPLPASSRVHRRRALGSRWIWRRRRRRLEGRRSSRRRLESGLSSCIRSLKKRSPGGGRQEVAVELETMSATLPRAVQIRPRAADAAKIHQRACRTGSAGERGGCWCRTLTGRPGRGWLSRSLSDYAGSRGEGGRGVGEIATLGRDRCGLPSPKPVGARIAP
jgi:hypothetical protein